MLRCNMAALSFQVIFNVRFIENLFTDSKPSASCVCGAILLSCGLVTGLRLRNTRDLYLQF